MGRRSVSASSSLQIGACVSLSCSQLVRTAQRTHPLRFMHADSDRSCETGSAPGIACVNRGVWFRYGSKGFRAMDDEARLRRG
jgi:hypothetical protein